MLWIIFCQKKYLVLLGLIVLFQVFVHASPLMHETTVYKKIDGYKLKVDVFYTQQNTGTSKKPAIAFFHGGG